MSNILPSILLIDDNFDILTANSNYLMKNGFNVTCTDTGLKALECLSKDKFDCIVLDILLPDLDGYSICKAVRTVSDTPILFLSCLEETDNIVKGLMLGGDDYMTKPCSLKELAARITTLIRRRIGNDKEQSTGDLYIDHDNKIINVKGKYVLLSEREFKLFLFLYDNPNKLFLKEDLIKHIWRGNAEKNTLATLVARLRRKIEFAEDKIGSIVSEYGAGYKLMHLDRKQSR